MSADSDASLPGPWFAARLGIDPVALDARRRAGEFLAVRPAGSPDWLYPSWQLDEEAEVKAEVRRVLEAAREARMGSAELGALLRRRVGLAGGQTFGDLLAAGDAGPVVGAIRGRSTSR